jgi:hypothetical protein
MQDRKSSGCEDLIDKFISRTSIWTLMTGVVEFYAYQRLHCDPIAQQKIYVLTVYLVGVNSETALVVGLDREQVAQCNFSAKDNTTRNRSSQHIEEA